MTDGNLDKLNEEWHEALGGVVGAARLVAALDSTNEQPLEYLKEALFRLGCVEERIKKLYGNA